LLHAIDKEICVIECDFKAIVNETSLLETLSQILKADDATFESR